MQLTDWLLVEVVLLLLGLTKNSRTKSSFDTPSVIESPLRLRALALYEGMHSRTRGGWVILSAAGLLTKDAY
jgi:hypothetical protein